jgi:hypothetical protein
MTGRNITERDFDEVLLALKRAVSALEISYVVVADGMRVAYMRSLVERHQVPRTEDRDDPRWHEPYDEFRRG